MNFHEPVLKNGICRMILPGARGADDNRFRCRIRIRKSSRPSLPFCKGFLQASVRRENSKRRTRSPARWNSLRLSGSDRQSTARSKRLATTDNTDNTDRCELKRRNGEGLPLEQIVTALLPKGRVLSCRTSGNNLARSVSGAAGSSDAEAAKGSGERGRSRGSFKSVVQNLFEHDRELATASPSFGGQEQSMSKRNWVDAVTLPWLAAASLKAATLQRGETYSCSFV